MRRFIFNFCLSCFMLITIGCQSPSQPGQILKPLSKDENTIVLDSGERVCNLAGQWSAIYKNNRGGINKDIVDITQTGREFIGVKTKGNLNVSSGQETVKGIIKSNGFENFKAYHSSRGWINVSSEITSDCNQIAVKTAGASIVLIRLDEQI